MGKKYFLGYFSHVLLARKLKNLFCFSFSSTGYSIFQSQIINKVTLAVYFYFLAALFGAQWVTPASSEAYETIYKTYGRCPFVKSYYGKPYL